MVHPHGYRQEASVLTTRMLEYPQSIAAAFHQASDQKGARWKLQYLL